MNWNVSSLGDEGSIYYILIMCCNKTNMHCYLILCVLYTNLADDYVVMVLIG